MSEPARAWAAAVWPPLSASRAARAYYLERGAVSRATGLAGQFQTGDRTALPFSIQTFSRTLTCTNAREEPFGQAPGVITFTGSF
jgi:hypothetical protein